MLRVEHLSKKYETGYPLKDVSFEVNKGDVICLIGPSGCGKSTLINCLNRMVEPSDGRIWLDDIEITNQTDMRKLRQRMGMVFQSYNLFSHLTILENMMMAPMDLLGMPRQDAYKQAMELLARVGLADKADRYPSELSGGQQQRVAIVRALTMKPEILLLDEPTSALDPTMVGEVEAVIRDLANQGLTMMIVTHEMRFAKNVSNRVFYLDEGGVYEDAPPEEFFNHPKREKTRWFLRRMKVFEREINTRSFDFLALNSEITLYGQQQRMNPRTLSNLQLIYEEMIINLLLPRVKDPVSIKFTVAYDEEQDIAEIVVQYESAGGNPLENSDDLSVMLIRGIAKNIFYDQKEGKSQLTLQLSDERKRRVQA